jgi:hypothetical protein
MITNELYRDNRKVYVMLMQKSWQERREKAITLKEAWGQA